MNHPFDQAPLSLPFHESVLEINLEAFPIVEDLFVAPVSCYVPGAATGFSFTKAELRSEKLGYLAHYDFGRVLRTLGSEGVPVGTLNKPWFQFEQGWEIEVFEANGYIHICQGDNENPTEYVTWFRVRSQDYWNAWSDWLAEVEALQ